MIRKCRQYCRKPWEVRTFPGPYVEHKSSSSLSLSFGRGGWIEKKKIKKKHTRNQEQEPSVLKSSFSFSTFRFSVVLDDQREVKSWIKVLFLVFRRFSSFVYASKLEVEEERGRKKRRSKRNENVDVEKINWKGKTVFRAVGTTAKEVYFDTHETPVGARVCVLGAGISPAISSLSSSAGKRESPWFFFFN